MANSYFKFKQFTIHQDKVAMKVGTDGVLLGALAETRNAKRILDIGTGTGLVALMLAQRSMASIDAVEIDKAAARQALENVNASPWAKQIRVLHLAFEDFYPKSSDKYDLIVSNPPYFRNSLQSDTLSKNLARHADDNFHAHLLIGCAKLLTDAGKCSFILPTELADEFILRSIGFGLFISSEIAIKSLEKGKTIRKLITLQKKQTDNVSFRQLVIYINEKIYTDEFTELMKPYYLNF